MNLDEYAARAERTKERADLSVAEREAALDLIAKEIDGCLWQGPYQQAARELSAKIRASLTLSPWERDAGFDSLGMRGLLRPG